ncbi:neprilysin-1-like isoform X1 [Ornithodoros turicata]|uniref:neprilysin-1-like isoform X1 n=1 Tax=Ornithodoros turicata TaxID=34597 RepID=UPI00313986FD
MTGRRRSHSGSGDNEDSTPASHPTVLLSAKIEALLGVKVVLVVGLMIYVILTPVKRMPGRGKLEECDDIRCYDIRRQMLTTMNLSVDPCDDFYSFVCGQWSEWHPGIPDQIELMQNYVNELVRDSIKNYNGNAKDPDGPLDKAVLLYTQCTHIFLEGKEQTTALRQFLHDLGMSWPNTTLSNATLVDVLVSLSLSWLLPVLVNVDLVPDTPTKRIISIGTDRRHEQWLSHRANYLDGHKTQRVIMEFAEAISGGCASDYADFANEVLRADVDIAVRWVLGTIQRETPQRLTFADLDAMNHSSAVWLSAINANLPNDTAMTPTDEFLLVDEEVLYFIEEFQRDYNEETSLAVVGFYALVQLAVVSSYQMTDALFGRPYDKTVPLDYVAYNCIRVASDVTSFAVAQLAFGKVLKAEDLDEVQKLVDAMNEQMAAVYESRDNETVHMIRSLRTVVAWPPGLNGTENQDKFYSYLPKFQEPVAKFYLNSLYGLRNREKKELKRSNQNPVFYDEDQITVLLRAEPGYDPPRNELLVPPAAIVPPLFLSGHPAFSYGALGHTISRELWLALVINYSPQSTVMNNTVGGQEQCLLDFYKDQGVKPDDLAMQEIIADTLGMASGLGAYQTSANDTSEVAGFSGQQLFFISSCFKLCSENSTESSGRYAAPQVRCNGPLMLSEAFSKAFGCSKKAAMAKALEKHQECAVLGNSTAEPPVRRRLGPKKPVPSPVLYNLNQNSSDVTDTTQILGSTDIPTTGTMSSSSEE